MDKSQNQDFDPYRVIELWSLHYDYAPVEKLPADFAHLVTQALKLVPSSPTERWRQRAQDRN